MCSMVGWKAGLCKVSEPNSCWDGQGRTMSDGQTQLPSLISTLTCGNGTTKDPGTFRLLRLTRTLRNETTQHRCAPLLVDAARNDCLNEATGVATPRLWTR